MKQRKCMNCAWFCHAEKNCWKDSLGENPAYPMTVKPEWVCGAWASDGLGDEERADLYPEYALVTMEEK